jgi:hypothetical protein
MRCPAIDKNKITDLLDASVHSETLSHHVVLIRPPHSLMVVNIKAKIVLY